MTFDKLTVYAKTLRPNYWLRNLFIFFGSFAAWCLFRQELSGGLTVRLAAAFICACLVSSANYVINEVLDAPFDACHPAKKFRAVPQGLVSVKILAAVVIVLLATGLAGSLLLIDKNTSWALLSLFAAGLSYNVKPLRLKDIPVVDIISESANNPIRFLIGWYAASATTFPPLIFLACFWTFGAMLISVRRLGEILLLTEGEAGSYRKTFRFYTPSFLTILYASYAALTVALLATAAFRYAPKLLYLTLPFVVFAIWLFRIRGNIRGS